MRDMDGGRLALPLAVALVACWAVAAGDDLMVDEESGLLQGDISAFLPVNQAVGDLSATKQIDLVFLLHTGMRMNKFRFNYFKTFMKDIVRNAYIQRTDGAGVRVALVNYRKRGRVIFDFNQISSKEDAISSIDRLQLFRSKGGSLVSGLEVVRRQLLTSRGGDRPEVPNVVIVLTDAKSKLDTEHIQSAAQRLRDSGSRIIAVGVGKQSMERELRLLVSSTRDVYRKDTLDELVSVKNSIIKQVYPLQNQEPDSRQADVVILYHLSNTMSPKIITKYFNPFLSAILDGADIDGGNVRVSLINFAKRPRAKLNFNQGTSKRAVMDAINNIGRQDRSKTGNAGTALKYVRTKLFTKKQGDREGVSNTVILIMDQKAYGKSKSLFRTAEKLKSDGTKIITIGMQQADMAELREISTQPADNHAIYAQYQDIASRDIISFVQNNIVALRAGAARIPQPTESFVPSTTDRLSGQDEADVVFALHFSPSRSSEDFYHLIALLQSLIATSDVDGGKVRIGLYISGGFIRFDIDDYRNNRELALALSQIVMRDAREESFNLVRTIKDVRQRMFVSQTGFQRNAPKALVIITDKNAGQDSRQLQRQSDMARGDNIAVYTMGIGVADKSELELVATSSKTVYAFSDYRDLEQFGGSIRKSLRAFDSRQAPAPTESMSTVAVPTRKVYTPAPTTTTTTTTTTRRPTTPRRIPPPPREDGIDLIFMLDSTVNDRVFTWMKKFVVELAQETKVDTGEWRIGGMTFDSKSRSQFNLQKFNWEDEIIDALKKLNNRPSGRKPDVGGAFDYVRRRMFVEREGDRPRARNFVVLLTGNEKFLNSKRSFSAATRLKDLGTGVFTVGFNMNDLNDINEVSSQSLEEHRTILNEPGQVGDTPAIYAYRMQNAPEPTTRRTTTTTTTTYAPPTDCKARADIVFLLDTSGSVGEYHFALMKNFTYRTVRDLSVDSGHFRIAYMTFSDTSQIHFQLNSFTTQKEISDRIQEIPYVYGHTHTADALRRIRTEMFIPGRGDRLDVPNLVVIVTDGQSNINREETIPEARMLKNEGVTIMAVGIGSKMHRRRPEYKELQGMASEPTDKHIIEVKDFDALGGVTNKLVAPLCSDQNQCLRDPCKNEGACVDGLSSYMCLCPPGFYGINCEHTCGEAADVALVLDSSTSIGSRTFRAIKSYAMRIVMSMEVLSCDINVGVMKYSSAAMIQFNLGHWSTEEEIIQNIQRIGFTPGRSNMADALKEVRTRMFNGQDGDRPEVRNIAYLLTDGSVEINKDITLSEASLAIDSGVRLIPIAVGLRDRTEIELIADIQNINLIEIEEGEGFELQADQVLEEVHNARDFCSPNPCANGGECDGIALKCKCPEGFTGERCERSCNQRADVVFVVDSSRYNTGKDFRMMKRFLRDQVKRLAFRGDRFRMGLVEYGSVPRVRLSLMDGDNKKTVKATMAKLRAYLYSHERVRGNPDLSKAIQLVDYSLFNSVGDRRDVPNYLVILTRSMGGRASVEAINKLKAKGTKVFGIGIGLRGTELDTLKTAVSFPASETMFNVPEAKELMTLSSEFVNFACAEHNACSSSPCQNGGSCVSSLHDQSYHCVCVSGFAGQNCDRTCDDRMDVVFLMDSSGSVSFTDFSKKKEFLQHMVESLNVGPMATQVGVASFSSTSRAEVYLNQFTDKRSIQDAISGINYEYGSTNTAAGIKLARSSLFSMNHGNRPNVPDFLFVITDGESNVNSKSTIPEAELAREQGIHIFALGVGLDDPWELNGIASKPLASNVYKVNNWEDLWGVSNNLIDSVCHDNQVCAGNPCQNGGQCVVGPGHYTCKCMPGYIGEDCELDCSAKKDICFIVDSSNSVGGKNFKTKMNFIAALVEDLTHHDTNHQFCLIRYSTTVSTIFSLNRYSDKESIIHAIKTTSYVYGSSNTAGALRAAINMFTPAFGDRPDADNVAILVTDGDSNINYRDTSPAAQDLRDSGAKVIGIGIGLRDFKEINSIASSTQDVYKVRSFSDLAGIKRTVEEGTCRA